ncbi:ABC transporter permease [Siphonobacter aquaeclarae]|uniref:Transport permease protein n=1 Tax=Siphonobacter aquaeclarae TaxID=563176 RepID=A0A1G9K744_9BACT|nr:ABC transporter permease [Siphonobacter aquaeclarae]SDL45617.1 lipopolysaccharide transport system permease protein [Siphonobacter aquaeclarae]
MQETIIENGRSQKTYWSELLKSSELFWILAKRDITVRYKQTVLGVVWSIVRPVLTTAVLFFAFGKVAKLEFEPGVPSKLAIFAGVLLWNFFANSLAQVSSSIVANSNLVSKVYFPRLILPTSSVMVGFVDFLVGCSLFLPLYGWYFYKIGFHPSWQLLFTPVFLLLAYLAAFSFGLILAVMNVKYRDFSQLTPFIIQFGFYACPVGYSVFTLQKEWWYPYYNLNPVVGLIDGFRWCLLGGYAPFRWESFIPSVIIILSTVVLSIIFFRKRENGFVDYI